MDHHTLGPELTLRRVQEKDMSGKVCPPSRPMFGDSTQHQVHHFMQIFWVQTASFWVKYLVKSLYFSNS